MIFKKLCLEDRDLIYKYIQSDCHQNCIFSFGNNVLWNKNNSLEYTLLDDILIYRTPGTEEIRYCTPDFKEKWEMVIDAIHQDAQRLSVPYRISSLQKKDLEIILKNNPDRYRLEYRREQSDYIYLVEDLAKLKGRRYEKKRNLINYFEKRYNWNYKQLTFDMLEICREYEEQWLADKLASVGPEPGQRYIDTLYLEKSAIDYALEHFEQLNLTGGVLLIDGKCVAFTIGEKLNNTTFVQHFEKAERSVKGAYQMILQKFVQEELFGRYCYVNREEDMGNPAVRQTKLSYHPVYIFDKFTLHGGGGI